MSMVGKERTTCEWWNVNPDTIARLVLAAVSLAALLRVVWVRHRIQFAGRRSVLAAWIPALTLSSLFWATTLIHSTAGWVTWFSRLVAGLVLSAVFITVQAMRDTERVINGHHHE